MRPWKPFWGSVRDAVLRWAGAATAGGRGDRRFCHPSLDRLESRFAPSTTASDLSTWLSHNSQASEAAAAAELPATSPPWRAASFSDGYGGPIVPVTVPQSAPAAPLAPAQTGVGVSSIPAQTDALSSPAARLGDILRVGNQPNVDTTPSAETVTADVAKEPLTPARRGPVRGSTVPAPPLLDDLDTEAQAAADNPFASALRREEGNAPPGRGVDVRLAPLELPRVDIVVEGTASPQEPLLVIATLTPRPPAAPASGPGYDAAMPLVPLALFPLLGSPEGPAEAPASVLPAVAVVTPPADAGGLAAPESNQVGLFLTLSGLIPVLGVMAGVAWYAGTHFEDAPRLGSHRDAPRPPAD